MYPISVKKNNYHKNKKNSTIKTPVWLSEQIDQVIPDSYKYLVLDVCCNNGNLSYPYSNRYGIDIVDYDSLPYPKPAKTNYIKQDFLYSSSYLDKMPSLVVCNPPFNSEGKKFSMPFDTKYGSYKSKLLPMAFMIKIFETYGYTIPLVLFVPMGFLANQRVNSKRYQFIRDCGASISSIMSLPINVFCSDSEDQYNRECRVINRICKEEEDKNNYKRKIADKYGIVLFHTEIVFFNIPELKPHYFIGDRDGFCS